MNRRDFLQGLFAAGVVAVAAPATIIEAPLKAPIDVIVERLTFEEIAATTLKLYRPILADQIMRTSPFVTYLKEGKIPWVRDGRILVEPIIKKEHWI
jgi:hypothetical protein